MKEGNKEINVLEKDVDKAVRETLPVWASVSGDMVRLNPEFASRAPDNAIEVDASKMYPYYLQSLTLATDQFSAEVARRCMTADLSRILGSKLHVRIINADAFRLKDLPEKEGLEPGTSASLGQSTYLGYFHQIINARQASAAAH